MDNKKVPYLLAYDYSFCRALLQDNWAIGGRSLFPF